MQRCLGKCKRQPSSSTFPMAELSPLSGRRRRDSHLAKLDAPALFCSGTNDAFASPDELRGLTAVVPGSLLHLLEGADHGFAVPKSSGRTRQDVWMEAASALRDWLAALDA